MPLYIGLTGYLLYMHFANLYSLGDNTQVQRIAQSDSVSEAAKIFIRNQVCSFNDKHV